ncbi:MAG: hypothetical protein IT423_17755 [Pirellulaceae bacterium]|nr:hypothetical protein [Pirellulaceae bacterium]
MLCPFCLLDSSIEMREEERGGSANAPGRRVHYLACKECGSQIPRMYKEDYEICPPAIVSAVGFSQHGKSVYLSSLYRLMRSQDLVKQWKQYLTWPLNQDSLDRIRGSVKLLDACRLPAANPQVFPMPTLMQVKNVPNTPNSTLVLFDTAGEAFRDVDKIGMYANFVARADTILFFVSLANLTKGSESVELDDLMQTYVIGARELGTPPKSQSLCIVFTKSDRYADIYGKAWPGDQLYMTPGDEAYTTPYQVNTTTRKLTEFLDEHLKAKQFLANARDFFNSVHMTYVSALGQPPNSRNELDCAPRPCRMLDPILHVIRRQAHTRLGLIGKFMQAVEHNNWL